MPYDPQDPAYFDAAAAERELARVTGLCDGWRRCHRLCPAFDSLLDAAVDGDDGDLAKPAHPRSLLREAYGLPEER